MRRLLDRSEYLGVTAAAVFQRFVARKIVTDYRLDRLEQPIIGWWSIVDFVH